MTASVTHRVERHCSWTRDYWIAHCEGYRVDSPAGHLGFVEEVIQAADGEPCSLTVRRQYGPDGLLVVPIECVHEIDPPSEHFLIESDAYAPMSRTLQETQQGS